MIKFLSGIEVWVLKWVNYIPVDSVLGVHLSRHNNDQQKTMQAHPLLVAHHMLVVLQATADPNKSYS